jgi:hypothetical protein
MEKSLLERHYAVVFSLRDYLVDILESEEGDHSFLPSPVDSDEYHSLINTSFVALSTPSDTSSSQRRIKVFPPMMYMHEVRDEVLYAASIQVFFVDH